jgi:hypothetical protein
MLQPRHPVALSTVAVNHRILSCRLLRLLLCLLLMSIRYQELAGQHQKILQHLNHRIEKITGVFDH